VKLDQRSHSHKQQKKGASPAKGPVKATHSQKNQRKVSDGSEIEEEILSEIIEKDDNGSTPRTSSIDEEIAVEPGISSSDSNKNLRPP
jgi:hypothetical protein